MWTPQQIELIQALLDESIIPNYLEEKSRTEQCQQELQTALALADKRRKAATSAIDAQIQELLAQKQAMELPFLHEIATIQAELAALWDKTLSGHRGAPAHWHEVVENFQEHTIHGFCSMLGVERSWFDWMWGIIEANVRSPYNPWDDNEPADSQHTWNLDSFLMNMRCMIALVDGMSRVNDYGD